MICTINCTIFVQLYNEWKYSILIKLYERMERTNIVRNDFNYITEQVTLTHTTKIRIVATLAGRTVTRREHKRVCDILVTLFFLIWTLGDMG